MPVFFEHALRDLAIGVALVVVCGHVTAPRSVGSTFAGPGRCPGFPIGFLLLSGNPLIALPVWGASLYACALGARWHREDLELGADQAERRPRTPGHRRHDPPPLESGVDQAAMAGSATASSSSDVTRGACPSRSRWATARARTRSSWARPGRARRSARRGSRAG